MTSAYLPGLFQSAALPWGSFESPNAIIKSTDFQFLPQYRAKRPIDDLLLKLRPGLDKFITEQYAADIGAILNGWSLVLLGSTSDLQPVRSMLSDDFVGSSLKATQSRVVREEPPVEVRINSYSAGELISKSSFLESLKIYVSEFTKLSTARFQIVRIEDSDGSDSPASLRTRIRYEIVGQSRKFYREQRVGFWDLEWIGAPVTYRIRRWLATEETWSGAKSEVFADITASAFRGLSSYSQQLAHGADYWRTVLDVASGIDIYGHNGVSVGDIDNDGQDDLYVCQAAGLPNRLYRNRGDGTFEDITEHAGVGVLENTACALFADLRNTGNQDLIVVRNNGPLLFLNEGNGKFRQQPDAFQFAQPPQGTFTGAALADYDRDGFLDVYFCLYLYYQGTDQYKYPSPYYDAQNGPPNFLMRNNRDGTFFDVTARSGMNKHNSRYSFCCGWNDFNDDGWPDLYVVNDFGRKNLYRNNGDGTFTDVAAEMGVEDVGAGMSVAWADFDNDGLDDLYVANMWTAAGERISSQPIFQENAPERVQALYRKHAMGNSLFRNQASHKASTFRDVTSTSGAANGGWSWSSDAWDFDHDGHLDLYVTNGMVSGLSPDDLNSFFWRQVVANSPNEPRSAERYEEGWNAINEMLRSDVSWSGNERNVFFARNGDGTFSDVSGAVNMDFLEDGRSFALSDFDGDGRQEVFLKNRNAPQLRLLKNVISNLPAAISFRLRGEKSNRDAIGAVIVVESEAGKQSRTLQAGSGFLSQHSKDMFFGLGPSTDPVRASIRWPSGTMQQFHDLPANHRVIVVEGNDRPQITPFRERVAVHQSANVQASESLPGEAATWLLAPLAAPDFSLSDVSGEKRSLYSAEGKPLLLSFWVRESAECQTNLDQFRDHYGRWETEGVHLFTVNLDLQLSVDDISAYARTRRYVFPILRGTKDVGAIYNIVYLYLFDRHRNLPLPTSFLIDQDGSIVKVYQGVFNPESLEADFRTIPRTHADRQRVGLPFTGLSTSTEFRRNYLSVGSIFFQRGYYEQAGVSFRQALIDNSSSAEALYGLGSVYLKQEKKSEARDAFERVTKLQADYPDTLPNAWNNLGLLHAREGRTEAAILDFKTTLGLSPNHLIALNNLGNAYRQAKQWDDARHAFEQVLLNYPEDADANYGLAMVFAQKDDANRAYEYLQNALKSRPEFPEALNNLGIVYLRTDRRDEAVATFEKCIRVAPEFDQAYINLARLYAIEGAKDKARAVLSDLLKQRPGHSQAQKALEELAQ